MSRRLSPMTAIAGVLVVGGAAGLLRGRASQPEDLPACEPGTPGCEVSVEAQTTAEGPLTVPLTAAEACRNVGYLCAPLELNERMRLQRWKDFSGTIVIHVPRPSFESAADGARLQQAAMSGLRAWNSQPYQIFTDLSGERTAHFSVTWTRNLTGSLLGVARTRWSAPTGLQVVTLELATRWPYDPNRVIDPQQVRLTAAHEMGHALGLPHSSAENDVMYPSNTATSLSAQDYRTMESLYRMPDGTEIVR
jgi:predicted Zn-dependent protease